LAERGIHTIGQLAAMPGARWTADCAVDKIRDRFGWEAVEYGSALGLSGSVPDEFRELAEKDL
jgi:DNA polymerase-4